MSSIFSLRAVTHILRRGIPGGAEPVASDQDSSGSFEIAMAIGASACNEQSL